MTKKDEFVLYGFYNPRRIAVDAYHEGESLTDQSFAAECDINEMMKRYENFRTLPHGPAMQPDWGIDTSTFPPDFRSMCDAMLLADDAFMSLPASVRKEFENDAVAFVEFCQKAENLPKLREWGLAKPLEVAKPVDVRVLKEEPEGDPPGA